jgi:hypothetical protein
MELTLDTTPENLLRMVGHKRERLRDCFCTQKHLVDFEDLCPRSMLGFYRREKIDLGHDP